jgi:hypothetical protein
MKWEALKNLPNLAFLAVLLLASLMVHAQDRRMVVEVINGRNRETYKRCALADLWR